LKESLIEKLIRKPFLELIIIYANTILNNAAIIMLSFFLFVHSI
jgi:hypothetical protein